MRAAVLLFTTTLACGPTSGLTVGTTVPGFDLPDVNPTSPTHQQWIGPEEARGTVSVWYFGHSNCSYCSVQFGVLDDLADELAAEAVEVPIHGLNAAGLEAFNAAFVEGRDLPWLQDPDDGVWNAWGAVWRDLYLVDAQGVLLERWSLTDVDLREPANHQGIKAAILEAAGADPAEPSDTEGPEGGDPGEEPSDTGA